MLYLFLYIKVNRDNKSVTDKILTYALQRSNFVRNKVFQQARSKVMEQSRGLYPAPLKV